MGKIYLKFPGGRAIPRTSLWLIIPNSSHSVTENAASAACCNESQTRETGAGAKGKRFIQVLRPGRTGDSGLKDHFPFLLKPVVLTEIGRGGLF